LCVGIGFAEEYSTAREAVISYGAFSVFQIRTGLRGHFSERFDIFEEIEQLRRCYEKFVAEGFKITAFAAGGTLRVEGFYPFIQPGIYLSNLFTDFQNG
jgi:hypothetical protein